MRTITLIVNSLQYPRRKEGPFRRRLAKIRSYPSPEFRDIDYHFYITGMDESYQKPSGKVGAHCRDHNTPFDGYLLRRWAFGYGNGTSQRHLYIGTTRLLCSVRFRGLGKTLFPKTSIVSHNEFESDEGVSVVRWCTEGTGEWMAYLSILTNKLAIDTKMENQKPIVVLVPMSALCAFGFRVTYRMSFCCNSIVRR